MNPVDFLTQLWKKIQAQFTNSGKAKMQASDQQKAEMMLAMLASTLEEELTCDEVFALLGQFTEMAIRGEDVARLMPLVQQHLDLCRDCHEEYEVLQNILANAG